MSNEFLVSQNLLNGCIQSMSVPMVDLVSKSIVGTSFVTFPEGVGIDENGSSIYIHFCF